jgi:hypothetical protein
MKVSSFPLRDRRGLRLEPLRTDVLASGFLRGSSRVIAGGGACDVDPSAIREVVVCFIPSRNAYLEGHGWSFCL